MLATQPEPGCLVAVCGVQSEPGCLVAVCGGQSLNPGV